MSGTPELDAAIAAALAQAGPLAIAGSQPLPGTGLPDPTPKDAPPLFGEAIGEGYLFPHAPQVRQQSLVGTTPEIVRLMILRAMEVTATKMLLPYSDEDAAHLAEALLRCAQSYLLIDPLVDSEGVPVAGRATAQAAAQIAQTAAAPQPQGEAHGEVKRTPGKPPQVRPGAAAQHLAEMHEQGEAALHAARGSRPLPKPRVGS